MVGPLITMADDDEINFFMTWFPKKEDYEEEIMVGTLDMLSLWVMIIYTVVKKVLKQSLFECMK